MAAKHEIEGIPLRAHHRQEVEFIQSMVTNWEAIYINLYIYNKFNENNQTRGELELLSIQAIGAVSKQKGPIVWMKETIRSDRIEYNDDN